MKTQSFVSFVLAISMIMTSSAFAPILWVSDAHAEIVRTTKIGKTSIDAMNEKMPTEIEIKNGAVKSPLKGCEGVVLVERPKDTSKWKEQEAFWKDYPAKGCDTKVATCTRKVQFIPPTSFAKSFDPGPSANFSTKENANAFLKRVGEKAASVVKGRIAAFEARRACLNKPNDTCLSEIKDRMHLVRNAIPDFRLAIGRLSESSRNILASGTVVRRGEDIVFPKISRDKSGTINPDDMPGLSDSELKKIRAEFDTIIQDFDKKRQAELAKKGRKDSREDRQIALRERLDEERTKNVAAYAPMLAEYPELAAFNLDDTDEPKKMAAKFDLVIAKLKTQLKEVNDATAGAPMATGGLETHRLLLANFNPIMEQIIAQEGDARSCAVANAIINETAAIKTKDGLVVGGLIAAAALTTGGVGLYVGAGAAAGTAAALAATTLGNVALAIGIVGGTAETIRQNKAEDAKIAAAEAGLVDAKDAVEAANDRNINTALGLLNFQGSGALVGAMAGVAGHQLAKLGVVSALRTSEKAAASKLAEKVVAAQAGDKAAQAEVAKAASAETKALAGRDLANDEIKAISEAIENGLGGSAAQPNTELVREVADATKGMDTAARNAYFERFGTIGRALKGTPLGDSERVRAAGSVAASMAGKVPDSEVVAILKDSKNWGARALDGLAAVYQKTRACVGELKGCFKSAYESVATKAGMTAKQIKDSWEGAFCCSGGCKLKVAADAVDLEGRKIVTYSDEIRSLIEAGEPVQLACAAH